MMTRGSAYSEYSYAYKGGSSGDASGFVSALVVDGDEDVYSRAVSQLHVSVLPAELPCRQEEQSKVYTFLKNAIARKQGGEARGPPRPLYISGMPGTGKTATVHAAVHMLQNESQKGILSSFEFVEVNALRIPSPNDAYTVLWRGISGEHCAHKTALTRLKNYFDDDEDTSRSNVICLLDELDFLVTANESVVYNFFQWPQRPNAKLIIIGIANTMDLPERLSKRSLSRMGGQQMTRLAFAAYTHDQIFAILSNRLASLEGVFDKKSLELTARKAASAAGDLRSALKICQRYVYVYTSPPTSTCCEI
jgi:origin recognition complex subunit 1